PICLHSPLKSADCQYIILYHSWSKPMAAHVKVKKWGSSMAVLIPNRFAKEHKIDVGSILDLESVKIIRPKRRRYKMSELMAKFKPEHRHEAWDVGSPVGKEIW